MLARMFAYHQSQCQGDIHIPMRIRTNAYDIHMYIQLNQTVYVYILHKSQTQLSISSHCAPVSAMDCYGDILSLIEDGYHYMDFHILTNLDPK
jgi:hypothetical protein